MNAERFVVDTSVLISAALSPSGVPRTVVGTITRLRRASPLHAPAWIPCC